ncbi:MAG: flagellar biosynthesis anti-sigma factor FlgM, partial [Defluviitaleaceae bacterium]|nr:flagellar biosynthesis anti-sigma factor FlgM [Defluviitaleaceae bacterium]
AYGTGNATNSKKPGLTDESEKSRDVISLSTKAEDFQAVRKVLVNVPDVRADRISQVVAKLESGSYRVDSSDVAAKILQGAEG